MFGFGEARDSYDQVQGYDQNQDDNQPSLTHELIAGAASFEGMKAFENHQRKKGEAVSHGFAKELIAGFAGAAVDRFAETKGLDWVDRERAKRDAQNNAHQLYDSHYGGQDQYDPSMDPHQDVQQYM